MSTREGADDMRRSDTLMPGRECRALLRECRALWRECRALLRDYSQTCSRPPRGGAGDSTAPSGV